MTVAPHDPSRDRSRRSLDRRQVLVAGLAASALLATTAVPSPAAAAAAGRADGPAAEATDRRASLPTARLPRPTGPYAVGTVALHLVDRSRAEPWVPGTSARRELMVSLWYPARPGASARPVPQMTAGAAAHFGSAEGAAAMNLKMPPGSVDWGATLTHAHEAAPVDRRAGQLPVVLYSPGLGDPRTWNTALVEDLASRGYAVVTIDHTHEATEVAFPDGRLATMRIFDGAPPTAPEAVTALLEKVVAVRVADSRFVLDELARLNRTRFGGALDLRRVGMFGQSAGGFTAAQTMHDDRRFLAGINMDGQMDYVGGREPDGTHLSGVALDGLDRPLLLMGSGSEGSGDYRQQPSWAAFWANTRGWKADVTLTGSRHASYTDAGVLLPRLARQGAVPEGGLAGAVGTVPPHRALAANRAYVASFFGRWLRGHDDHLLDGPSDRFPEMVFAR
ncbi:esterase [Streptomyces sp. NBC_00378]|uniref:alpha/beta hydrolase family protein n=1 Tax=Streptomyces sp. NBC_00378 TaxID=2975732 RepID=UPI00225905A8|nr:esterase [Streptomyces sp. NBC_00378]MCX5110355.1 esterase [Streptomyces sp. NBC_00378]